LKIAAASACPGATCQDSKIQGPYGMITSRLGIVRQNNPSHSLLLPCDQ
jgi:hypothetical protein